MDSKKKQLYFALVIFLLALVGNKMYLDHRVQGASPGAMVTVVKAKRPLAVGTQITKSQMTQIKIPKKYAPLSAIRWKDRQTYYGQELAVDVKKNDYLLENAFIIRSTVANSLSDQIDGEAYRAVSLPVDQTNSLARSIVAGDRIDIMFTFTVPHSGQKMSVMLLQAVSVIATGSYSAAEHELGASSGRVKRYGTLTLKLSPQDAFRLIYARENGKLSILLRNSRNSESVEILPLAAIGDVLQASDRERMAKLTKNVDANEDMVRRQLQEIFKK